MLDPESRDVSNCHPDEILEICIPLCNDPIGLIKKAVLIKDAPHSFKGLENWVKIILICRAKFVAFSLQVVGGKGSPAGR